MIPALAIPTCAFCGGADAVTVMEWDHRAMPACRRCSAPVPEPDSEDPLELLPSRGRTRVQVLRAVAAHPGVKLGDLCEMLGVPPGAWANDGDVESRRRYERIDQVLCRAIRKGELRGEVDPADNRRMYFPVVGGGLACRMLGGRS